MTNHEPARRLGVGVEPELLDEPVDDLHVTLRLLEVPFPFFLEVVIHHASQRGLVDENSPLLAFESLKEQLRDMFLVDLHGAISLGLIGRVRRSILPVRARAVPACPISGASPHLVGKGSVSRGKRSPCSSVCPREREEWTQRDRVETPIHVRKTRRESLSARLRLGVVGCSTRARDARAPRG